MGVKDPTTPIRLKAGRYAGVEQGTSCTQSSFKAGEKAFLYIGMQGGRYKAMFKLKQSHAQAVELAKRDPERYEVGTTGWVTARFTADKPIPKRIWGEWLQESYELSLGSAVQSTRKKPAKKK